MSTPSTETQLQDLKDKIKYVMSLVVPILEFADRETISQTLLQANEMVLEAQAESKELLELASK